MGSLPRLKIKNEIRYRKGSMDKTKNCVCCRYFSHVDPVHAVKHGGCVILEDRLVDVGGNWSTRRTRVRADHKCDRQEYYVPTTIIMADKKSWDDMSATLQKYDLMVHTFNFVIDDFVIPLANMHLNDRNKYNIIELCRKASEFMSREPRQIIDEAIDGKAPENHQ